MDIIGIAVKGFAIGKSELRGFDNPMHEIGIGCLHAIKRDAFQQSELLQSHQTLRPRPAFKHTVPPVIIMNRCFDMRLPASHILSGQNPAMRPTCHVHDILRAAKLVNRFSDKALRPDFACNQRNRLSPDWYATLRSTSP